ncbi:hypothetical protein JCM8097_000692 [Rhodosporidiobolus ruineniae]
MSTAPTALDALRRAELAFPPPSGPFTPLLPPSNSPRRTRTLPSLPLRPASSYCPSWSVHTYIVPAAFPRTQRNGTRPSGSPSPVAHRPPRGRDGGQKLDLLELQEDVLGTQIRTVQQPVLDVEDDEAVEEQEQLYLAVNRYVPLRLAKREKKADGRKGLTLVLAHGTGMCKEIWEPVLQALTYELEKEGDVRVDEVFSVDTVNHADSAVLNEAVMGKGSNWCDSGRDLLNFLFCYLDSPTFSAPYPSSVSPPLLEPGTVEPAELALDSLHPPPQGSPLCPARTFRGRAIVGVGHSSGGSHIGFAASAAPYIFSSLILYDPWIIAKDFNGCTADSPFFRSVALRRDSWTTKEEAVKACSEKGFFKAWDREVNEMFLKHGLREMPDGTTALKTPAAIERLIYSNPYGWHGAYLFRRLRALDTSLPISFLLPPRGQSIVDEGQLRLVIDGLPWASFERIPKSNHLTPQIQPKRVGGMLARKLRETYGREAVAKPKL